MMHSLTQNQTQVVRILFLAAEADPFVKIGGLGDVAGSLPAALLNLFPPGEGEEEDRLVDVRLALPLHGAIQRQNLPLQPVASYEIPYTGGPVGVEAYKVDMQGLPVYLIGGSLIPPDAPVYTADPAADGLKFTFFSLAALELARTLNWYPHVVHANDWHTAPAIYSLSLNRDRDPFYHNTATLLGVHNLPYLGIGAGPALAAFGLPPAPASLLPEWARYAPMALGLLTADHIVAPSPTYAKEILTPEFGSGLHDFLKTRAESISGILNGINIQRWDPRNDPGLPVNYGPESLASRDENKFALQRDFELAIDPRIPLFGMIARMDQQKGVDLVPEAFRRIAGESWQLIILGTGDPALEAATRSLEADFPDQARAVMRFDAGLSRRMYGGTDAMLIPSRYEPCGLVQMIAMRYGSAPVARATGGLKDTIQDYDQSEHSTGFLFDAATSEALASALLRTMDVFVLPQAWQALQRNGMAQDFSWARAAREYHQLYTSLSISRDQVTSAKLLRPKPGP